MKIGRDVRIWHREKSVFGNCRIGNHCVIHAPVWIGNDVKIGNNCKIQAFTFIPPKVEIGSNVFIGPHVCFTNDKHPPSGHWQKTIVGNNVSIGAGAIIMPGAHIGDNAIVGAGTIVIREVPTHTMAISKSLGNIIKPITKNQEPMKKFGVIGLGFIFNKHVEAIEENGGKIVIGCDIDESKKDKLPKDADFTDDWKTIKDVDIVSILTPNHLHAEMAKFFANKGKIVLVEKPPAIDSEDLKELSEHNNIFTVMQLRYHPELLKWKERIQEDMPYDVEMKICVRRDDWYFESWKGQEDESGGILLNIGVHYFDALSFLFGKPTEVKTIDLRAKQASGLIGFKNAMVNWEISLLAPMDNQKRMLKINGEKLNLSQGFENLHSKIYQELLRGRGMPIGICKDTIDLIETIKTP